MRQVPDESLKARFAKFLEASRANLERRRDDHPLAQIGAHILKTGGVLKAPLTVMVDITSQCNQNCIFCYRSGPAALMPQGRGQFTSYQTLDWLCQQFAALGVASVTLTGGEPTCHPDFLELVALVKGYGMALTLMTNGTNWSQNQVERLAGLLDPCQDRVELSFDAIHPDTYAKIRGSQGLGPLLNTLKWFGEYDIPFVTITVVLKENLLQVDGILDLALQNGAQACAVGPPFPKQGIPVEVYAPAAEVLALFEHLSDRRQSESQKIILESLHLSMSLGLSQEGLGFMQGEQSTLFICHGGRTSCFVDIAGGVHLCQYVADSSASRVGSIFATPFAELWLAVKEARQGIERQAKAYGCRDCPQFDLCRGACPALALERQHADFEKPACAYHPEI